MASKPSFVKKASVPFSTTPLDIEFAADGSTVVVALRDTSHLRLRKFPDIQVGPAFFWPPAIMEPVVL